jgi:plasmid maintenance system antidote protein VapI
VHVKHEKGEGIVMVREALSLLDKAKYIHERKGSTHEDLAKGLGVERSVATKKLNGVVTLTPDDAEKLCRHYGVNYIMFIAARSYIDLDDILEKGVFASMETENIEMLITILEQYKNRLTEEDQKIYAAGLQLLEPLFRKLSKNS